MGSLHKIYQLIKSQNSFAGGGGSGLNSALLEQIRDAIRLQTDIASSVWTDDSGSFYVRRDLVDQETGSITVAFTNSNGESATPTTGLRPLSSGDKDIVTDFYNATNTGIGYSSGDILTQIVILDLNGATPSSTFIWINLSIGSILTNAPAPSDIQRTNGFNEGSSTLLQEINNRIGADATGTGVVLPAAASSIYSMLAFIWDKVRAILDRLLEEDRDYIDFPTTVFFASNDNIVLNPENVIRYISDYKVQTGGEEDATFVVKTINNGNTKILDNISCPFKGTGVIREYHPKKELKLAANTSFVINSSHSMEFFVSGRFRYE